MTMRPSKENLVTLIQNSWDFFTQKFSLDPTKYTNSQFTDSDTVYSIKSFFKKLADETDSIDIRTRLLILDYSVGTVDLDSTFEYLIKYYSYFARESVNFLKLFDDIKNDYYTDNELELINYIEERQYKNIKDLIEYYNFTDLINEQNKLAA